jgi:hypothetical protein
MPRPSEVLIWINVHGLPRELTNDEKKYVDTEYSPFDGARPYIKSNYGQRNGWGELSGFLQRTEVPEDVPIGQAPPPDPPEKRTPEAVADQILRLIQKPRPER